ncbi:MAG TPA: peptidoglycan DD-metalloendopeptidase family protein [Gammaproteobacteria bacterium]|jgi:murein DD-endopeptidase MepM/ murein hydrolase activator NlpD|nr:peptidoglycan DD-metalloendopeptidase family protein [Gammaproteobacteria bacterium]
MLRILLIFLSTVPTAFAATLPTPSPVPGGIAIVPLPAHAEQASYDGRRVMVMPHDGRRYAVIGVPLDTQPGEQTLTVKTAGGERRLSFQVNPKQYATQRLTIKNKSMVTLSKADLERVHRERKIIDAVYDDFTPSLYAKLPFALPVDGIESSPFGVRRILNGKPRSPHSGIDIAAPAGTPVRAPADGVVAEVGDFFFNGNTVIINHGEGLVSVYVHLSKIKVHEGDHVKRGQIIAQVGSTGRTTGADLHWTVTLNGTKINPELLLSPAALASLH